ncbi:MAG TPA: LysR family transcriptional regulator, partial [Candidatus Caccocola faecipullorum]|nr:LysR family transcriptional regulator [Candidatus Caccocola faecipullorum]
MELRVLQYFLAIAREESISRAAEYLHITQPTLSRQIKELEDELGRRLFVRGSRKITLTEEGMLLRKRAEEITALLDKTESEISSAGEAVSGDVFIGCAETDRIRFLLREIKRMGGDYPGVRFHLFSGHEEAVAERLDKGLIDFALFVGQVNLDKYNYLTFPQEDGWGFLMRSDHPLAAKPVVRPADLEGVPLICSRQMLDNNEMSGWLGRDFRELDIVATYNLV